MVRSRIAPMAALLAIAVTMTGAEARGFGGGHNSGAIGPRIGAWGRPLGPVRPGGGFGGRAVRPGFAIRHPYLHGHWHGGAWAYGLAGLGLGWGLGGLFGDDVGYPYVADDVAYGTPVETEGVAADLPAAVAACARRFKTYDPVSQTYVGNGYVRRHCP